MRKKEEVVFVVCIQAPLLLYQNIRNLNRAGADCQVRRRSNGRRKKERSEEGLSVGPARIIIICY